MIVQKAEKEALGIGVQENSFGFVKDVDFLIDAMINLYSNPKESIIRELVSNAYDASLENKESGETRVVVVVDKKKIVIQDFGKGMSTEFMRTRYTLIGDSTKRENEEAIGAFGFGRLSILSYISNYLVITVFEGVRYTYYIWRDGGIHLDLIEECEATEESGTRVEFNLKSEYDLTDWRLAINSQLKFFDNVVIKWLEKDPKVLKPDYVEYNGNKFFVSNSNALEICFGKVTYPLHFRELGLYNIQLPFAIYIPLNAKIRVPPSREHFIYDSLTKETITEYINSFLEWLKTLKSHYDVLDIVDKCTVREKGYLPLTIGESNAQILNKFIELGDWELKIFSNWETSQVYKFFTVKYTSIPKKKYNTNPVNILFEDTVSIKQKEFLKQKYSQYYNLLKRSEVFIKEIPHYSEEKDVLEYESNTETKKNEFQLIQDCWASKFISQEEALSGFEVWAQTNKVVKEKKEGFNYFRKPLSGDSICVQDTINLSVDKLKSDYSQIFYNMENKNIFKFVNGLLGKKNIILNLPKKEILGLQLTNVSHKLFDLSMEFIQNNNILKKLYVAALIQKHNIPNFDSSKLEILREVCPSLLEDMILIDSCRSTENAPEQWLNAVILMAEELKISSEVLVVIDRVVKILGGLYPLINISPSNRYSTDTRYNTMVTNYFKMFIKLKRLEHFYPEKEEIKEQQIETCLDVEEGMITVEI